MTKRQKKTATIEPRFILPGDEARVQAMAYAHGLDAIPCIFFMQLPPGAPVAKDYVLFGAHPQEDIEEIVQGATDTFVNAPELNAERPITNSLPLFRGHYSKAFAEGYRFGFYAISHGLINLLSYLPAERRYGLCFSFAWKLYVKESPYEGEPESEDERLEIRSMEVLEEMYKDYKSLN